MTTVAPSARKMFGAGPADAASAAGHQCDFSVQF